MFAWIIFRRDAGERENGGEKRESHAKANSGKDTILIKALRERDPKMGGSSLRTRNHGYMAQEALLSFTGKMQGNMVDLGSVHAVKAPSLISAANVSVLKHPLTHQTPSSTPISPQHP